MINKQILKGICIIISLLMDIKSEITKANYEYNIEYNYLQEINRILKQRKEV